MAAGFFAVNALAAPRLYFDPSSKTTTPGTDFQVKIMIDVESFSSFGADAKLSFPAGDLSVKSITNGGFYTDFSSAQNSGQIEIHGFFSTLYQSKTGSGTLATITFSPSKNTGTGSIEFVCDGSGSDTEILNSDGENILSCSSLNNLSLVYGTSDDPNPPTDNPSTNACGGTCGSNYNCNSGLFCYQGFCRNPICPSTINCNCTTTTPSPTPKVTTKPPVVKLITTSPTPVVVTLAKATPYPSPQPEESELSEDSPEGQSGLNLKLILTWLGLTTGSIVTIIMVVKIVKMLRRKNPPKINPPIEGSGDIKTYPVDPPLNTISEGPPLS